MDCCFSNSKDQRESVGKRRRGQTVAAKILHMLSSVSPLFSFFFLIITLRSSLHYKFHVYFLALQHIWLFKNYLFSWIINFDNNIIDIQFQNWFSGIDEWIVYNDNNNWLMNKKIHCITKFGVSVLKHRKRVISANFNFYKTQENIRMICVYHKLNLIHIAENLKLRICNIHLCIYFR